MQTIIEVKNLTHVYTDSENKEIKALDRINLERCVPDRGYGYYGRRKSLEYPPACRDGVSKS